jgi:hypothetical protein
MGGFSIFGLAAWGKIAEDGLLVGALEAWCEQPVMDAAIIAAKAARTGPTILAAERVPTRLPDLPNPIIEVSCKAFR